MAAWRGEPDRSPGFWLAFGVYLAAWAGLLLMILWKLWTEVLGAMPK